MDARCRLACWALPASSCGLDPTLPSSAVFIGPRSPPIGGQSVGDLFITNDVASRLIGPPLCDAISSVDVGAVAFYLRDATGALGHWHVIPDTALPAGARWQTT